jgi:hypothetical protein
VSARNVLACAKSGALFSALSCGDCPHLEMDGLHHCGLLLVEISARRGGMSQHETAHALGISQPRVREAEETALRKLALRIPQEAA